MKKRIAVLSGAGISAESGIQTFRDSNGLWENHNVQDVATAEAFKRNPDMVLRFYNERRRNIAKVQPNEAHTELVKLEDQFHVDIVTQNIDDLHERAGSSIVTHLHGEIFKMCSKINKHNTFPIHGDILPGDKAEDGYQLRPFIVWFGESVPMMDRAIEICMRADIFIVIGTSLQVYPAAGLINYASRKTPIYVIDKKIPAISNDNVISFEENASTGVKKVVELLCQY